MSTSKIDAEDFTYYYGQRCGMNDLGTGRGIIHCHTVVNANIYPRVPSDKHEEFTEPAHKLYLVQLNKLYQDQNRNYKTLKQTDKITAFTVPDSVSFTIMNHDNQIKVFGTAHVRLYRVNTDMFNKYLNTHFKEYKYVDMDRIGKLNPIFFDYGEVEFYIIRFTSTSYEIKSQGMFMRDGHYV